MKKVLYVVEDQKSAQFRYRVKNVIETLGSSKEWKAEFVETSKVERVDLKDVNLIVVLRQTAKDKTILDFIKRAKKEGKKVLFDLDDLIFDYRDLPILMKSTGSKNIFYWTGYVWGIRRIAKVVDGFISTNEFLGKLLKRTFNKPCVIMPNSLDEAQVEIAAECIKNKKKNNKFTIGYFSGSPTHAKDLRMVEPEILGFLDRHNEAELVVVGYMEFSEEAREFLRSGKIRALPLTNYVTLQKRIAEVDVNIAPLPINDFTNSKSELKFFEAGVVETVTIASPVYTFKKAIKNGENGLLAKPGEWDKKLEFLYQNPQEKKRMGTKARKDVLKNYYGKEFLKKIESAYGRFVNE